jgi:predicted glycosyltransferase
MQGLADVLPECADFVKLPSFDAMERDGKLVLFPARLTIERRELIAIRQAILTAVAESFDPDVLIADYTPLGKDEELEKAITTIRARGRRLILLGLRDILNDLSRAQTFLDTDVLAPLRQHFDAALVYSDPRWINFVEDHVIPADLSSRFIHVGYVVNDSLPARAPADIRNSLTLRGNNSLLVLLGTGGGKDALDILSLGVDAWERVIHQLPASTTLLILAGPYIRPVQWKWIQQRVAAIPSIRLIHQVRHSLEYLRAADLYVGACGYNAFTEVMSSQTPAIFIPRKQVDSDEQILRATRLQPKGRWVVINGGVNSRQELADALLTRLQNEKSSTTCDPIDLNGADRVGQFIANWYHSRLRDEA